MTRKWLPGALIAALIGLNIIQGAALAGLYLKSQTAKPDMAPIVLGDSHIEELPAPAQQAVRLSVAEDRPLLHARLKQVRQSRRDLKRYIAGPHYNRTEAQKRFAALRDENNQAQIVAQDMLLDAADSLSPTDRAEVMAAIDD